MAALFRKMPGVALSCLLFAGSAAFAQTTQLQGKVKGPDGTPLPNTVVRIERKDIKGNYPVKTNKKGEYLHAGLPLGTYKVVLVVDGKDADMVDNVKTKLGDPVNIDFDMQEVAKRNAAMQSAASSGAPLTQEQARGMTKEQQAEYEKQMKERSAAMAKNKELNDSFNAGMEAMKAKDYPTAITSFNKAGELDPKQVVVWGQLADAYAGLAKTKTGAEQTDALTKAGEAYAKAIELAPTDASFHNNYALTLAASKKFPEMQAEIDKAVQIDPAGAGKYYFNLGAVLTNAGQSKPACEAFKKAIDSDPNYADAHYQYGICLTSQATNKPDGTIIYPEGTQQAFQKYLELKPDGPNAESAKALLGTMGAKLDTTYTAPGAKKPVAAPKKK